MQNDKHKTTLAKRREAMLASVKSAYEQGINLGKRKRALRRALKGTVKASTA